MEVARIGYSPASRSCSKGGNLLLNVGPTGKGDFPKPAIERLKKIGDWMKINQEAVYGTTPWIVTSENVSDATLSNAAVHDAEGDVTSKVILPDIYFTSKEKTVYAIARSWKNAIIPIQNMAAGKQIIQSVTMLGTTQKISWQQTKDALIISMPKLLPNDIPVHVFKIMLN